ncbi:ABC transporter ATP-binding protein [Nocardioides albus]|uniref:Putative ABC transport system ATP-binding protein n=1 Tax=Nocardioides albus TaxID=1841 RepID=A0A7W5A4G2_9ACTN|nr:ABC transporter ATP-binding protein [Nocardioides albus]MBB3089462.1 putative ABC transport system ATP-binding protein [Nocardioides albus]GGU11872.1 ABC transporter ATP-binding protein [Nocardioides albus]
MTTPALEVVGLTRIYGTGAAAVPALNGLDLACAPGTFTAVMGPSGSGKSTFLTCAGALEQPTEGRVLIAGQDVTELSEARRTRMRRERIGFVFQGFHLLPYLTAEQNVALPLRLAGRRIDAAARRRIRELLDRVGLGDRAGHLPTQLSGGQQQRVAIARALVTGPDIVLADEPTGALDSHTAASVLALLRSLVHELGATVVMVTHDPVAAAYADSVVFLVDGRAVGRMENPVAEAVAGQMAHLDELTARTEREMV